MKAAKAALFVNGVLPVSELATLVPVVPSSSVGVGDGAPPTIARGMFSCRLALFSRAEMAGAWRELRLITPARLLDESTDKL